ncbi:MAG: polysaccharide pyruvyl transferase CsaB [Cyanobium sp.]
MTSAQIHPSVLVCGYYGEHNLGDDALLQVLLAQLPPAVHPLVTAWDQPLVRRVFKVETTDRRSLVGVLAALGRCRALVLGGGSLLQDSTSFRSLLYYGALIVAARARGMDVILWGQGLGPLRRRRSRLLARWLLSLATGISWRDPASTQLARQWGLRCLEGSDPVWALEPLPWQGRGGPIVVCWRPASQLDRQSWRPYLQALDQLAADSGRPVHWLPFHRAQDRELLAWLEQHAGLPERLRQASVLLTVEDPQAAMAQFQAAGLVIAMRLHGLILAALAGSPCVALSYDPKVAEAALGIGCACQDLSLPVADTLLASWQASLDQPPPAIRLELLRRGATIHREVLAPLSSLA